MPDWLLALGAATTCGMFTVNLNSLPAMRRSFMETEPSKKIGRVLRSNVRAYADEGFVTGDKTASDDMVLLKYWLQKVSLY